MNLNRRWVKSSALSLLIVGCGPYVDVLSTRDGGGVELSVGGSESITTGGSASTGTGGVTAVSTGGTPVDDSTLVTLERTGCYGYCPIYSLSIRGDGRVSYQGQQYVRLVGDATSQIPVDDVQSLVDTMVHADYFSLSVPDECPLSATDMPSANTSLTLNGQTHSVDHYHGNMCAPAVLSILEDSIDATAQSAQWVQCKTGSWPCNEDQGIGGSAGTGGASSIGGGIGNGGAGTLPATGGSTSLSTTTCQCQQTNSPCPNNASLCVTCSNSPLPAECTECPLPSTGTGLTCNALGLHCQYSGLGSCDCALSGTGASQWECSIIPF